MITRSKFWFGLLRSSQINEISCSHDVETPPKQIHADAPDNLLEADDDDKKKKAKKRASKKSIDFADPLEDDEPQGGHYFSAMSESVMGGQRTPHDGPADCPLLEAMERRCRGIDILSGDMHQELLQACGIHQLCYLCVSLKFSVFLRPTNRPSFQGASQSQCDYQYLNDANAICGHHGGCETAAQSALSILRGFPGPQLGPKECSKNPCLLQAIRAIGN